jgi:MFS family permease
MLTALPAGFGLAAVAAERILPPQWSDRRRCLAGGLLAAASALGLTLDGPIAMTVLLLGLLGLGLGTYIPANNSTIMAAIPARNAAAAGGMVNMTRGLGTASGVTVVTLALHTGEHLGHPGAGASLTMLVLGGCALAAALAARGPSAGPQSPQYPSTR